MAAGTLFLQNFVYVDKQKLGEAVPLRMFLLDPQMEVRMELAIRKAKSGKAPGPDGVAMELFKIYPGTFANVLYELFAACARLVCVVAGWDESILIPLYKKGLMELVKNYWPLRLILVLRTIFEMAADAAFVSESCDEPQQFGFQARTSAIAPALIVEEGMKRPGVISSALDLTQAYDFVNRPGLMKLTEAAHTEQNCGMIAMLVQPATVWTQGDETKTRRIRDIGVTQGGPASPRLYNLAGNELIRMMMEAVRDHLRQGDPSPVK